MRVLHVLNATSGGSTVSALELVKASRAAGTGIEHCAVYPGRRSSKDPEIHRVFHRALPIPLRAWNSPKNLDSMRRLALFALSQRESGLGLKTARALERVINEWSIDVVTTNCAVNIDGALAARKAGLPHVWHIRERIGSDGSMQFRLNDRRLVQRIAHLSARIAAVSEYVAEPFRKYGADADLEVVYDGVDLAAFAGPGARQRGVELRREWGIPDEAILVGMVANVAAHVKRHDLFLRAAASVARRRADVWFVIVGAIPSWNTWFNKPNMDHWHKLEALAHDLGLNDRLVWAGAVPDPPAVMSALDILGHACEIEGFPRVVIEAMAAGRPVLGPDGGGVVEIIAHGSTGILFRRGAVKDFAQAIEGLVVDQERRLILGRCGRQWVEEHTSLRRHLGVLVDLYWAARRVTALFRIRGPVSRSIRG